MKTREMGPMKTRRAQIVMKAVNAAPEVSHSSDCKGKALAVDPTVCCKGNVAWKETNSSVG